MKDLILFKNFINLIYKDFIFNEPKIYRIFFFNFIKKIIFTTFLKIYYPKNHFLNFEFLNYINIFDSIFGFKPLFKNLDAIFYIITKKKKLLFGKKKKFSFLEFKFFLYFNLNVITFIFFFKQIYFILDFYNKLYTNLQIKKFNIKNFLKFIFKNNVYKCEIINLNLFINFLFNNFYMFNKQQNKIYIFFFFFKIYNLKNNNLFFKLID